MAIGYHRLENLRVRAAVRLVSALKRRVHSHGGNLADPKEWSLSIANYILISKRFSLFSRYQESRVCLEELLQARPNCRPAISLLDILEDRIMKEGLLGLSVAGLILVTTGILSTVLIKRG